MSQLRFGPFLNPWSHNCRWFHTAASSFCTLGQLWWEPYLFSGSSGFSLLRNMLTFRDWIFMVFGDTGSEDIWGWLAHCPHHWHTHGVRTHSKLPPLHAVFQYHMVKLSSPRLCNVAGRGVLGEQEVRISGTCYQAVWVVSPLSSESFSDAEVLCSTGGGLPASWMPCRVGGRIEWWIVVITLLNSLMLCTPHLCCSCHFYGNLELKKIAFQIQLSSTAWSSRVTML